MRYTVPQLRLLKEGELYGNYTKPGDAPIDQLINFVQAYFIDWDLSNPKFISWYKKTHGDPESPNQDPNRDDFDDDIVDNTMKGVLLRELPNANQSPELIKKLIKRTKESSGQASGIMDAPVIVVEGYSEYFDLSVRAQRVLSDLGLTTVGKLIRTPKSDILSHRFVGRITLKEITKKVDHFLRTYGKGRNVPWGPASAKEWEEITAWIVSEPDLVRPPKRSAKSLAWPSQRKYP
jgi:hypothetical protein